MGKCCLGKAVSRKYKKRIPPCRDETFHMQLQVIIYEEFITLPESQQNMTEFYSDQPGSSNHQHKLHLAIVCKNFHPGRAEFLFCTVVILLCRGKIFACNCFSPPKQYEKVKSHISLKRPIEVYFNRS